MARVHTSSCSLRSVKSKERRGVKMFPTKTSWDVRKVDGVCNVTGSCMEKPTGGKSLGTRTCIPWQCNNPVNIRSGNILMQLGSVYRSALLTSTFSEISHLLMHRRFDFQRGLWPIIQVFVPSRTYNWMYRDCQSDIEQVLYFKTVTIYMATVGIYFEVFEADYCFHWFIH